MKEEDILTRHSRPQKHSTWVPKKRDWRYATGVFQHDDLQGAPNDRSAWDDMDYDYQVADTRKSRERRGSGQSDGDGKALSNSISAPGTPGCMKDGHLPEFPKTIVSVEASKKKSKTAKRSVWQSVSRCYQMGKSETEGEQPAYKTYSLTVRLRFSGKLIIKDMLPRMATLGFIELTQLLSTPAESKTPHIPYTPTTAHTAKSRSAPYTLDSIRSVHTYPLFQRTWVDETKDFNMRAVRGMLQKFGSTSKDLGPNYTWYRDAVPVDALLPPGVPLSAKEINAYYPHHIRWRGVMLRLANNDYRGPDIMGMQAFFRGHPTTNMSGAVMNQIQRDSVKNIIPGFKTDTTEGKHDANLHTGHLEPGRYIAEKRNGYTIPTFDDLLRGLYHLPSGLDARGFTECLSWYLSVRDSFTPKLDLNILHTQALIRALRTPLKRFGPQNLDCNTLEEWKVWGKFDNRKVNYEPAKPTSTKGGDGEQKRSQLHMNLDDHEVKLDIQLPLRHVLVFPFLALHGVVGEALKLGIEKAGNRKAEREGAEGRRKLEANWAARQAGDTDLGRDDENMDAEQVQEVVQEPETAVKEENKTKELDRIPRRPLTTEALRTLAPAQKKSPIAPLENGGLLGHDRPTGLRVAAPSTQAFGRNALALPGSAHLHRAWGVPTSSSAYAPHSVYGRRGS
ncbi:hypothetical protein G6011_00234 [Alternaria panax]|uniref:Uncharacterized protein n=1 Tax=Alternaria panax TaxID=48097 RepID=A0AAD4NUV3_9PLEO|nr:hypothetical protein G6011_00234 [Alternaria panax]